MLFNSISFAFFLPIVFILYWFFTNRNLKIQNLLLLVSSWYFYACWDYRFLFLLIFSTALDYYTGLKMYDAKNQSNKKMWFWLSVGINLGFLAVFKYYNFFIESFIDLLAGFGLSVNAWTIKIVLPVGISFYTFHGLSYVIDIYKDRIQPVRDWIEYSVFVSFFPLLVAGPIERATHLLPQIQRKRFFDYSKAVDGLRQILWGLFKKIVIADNCAEYANMAFNNPEAYSGSTLLLGAVFFAIQIYGDFSGYSDIAIGTARLLGIDLIKNFNYPYFSRDIAEFWRRWHISLTTWFRDYVYIPLGGSKGSTFKNIRNTFIIFILSGFWHGASWNFIIWGVINAVFFLPLLLSKQNRKNIGMVAEGRVFPTYKEFIMIFFTFSQVMFGWIFFRAKTLSDALFVVKRIFSSSILACPHQPQTRVILFTLIFIAVEWMQRNKDFALDLSGIGMPRFVRWSIYFLIIIFIIQFDGTKQEFIYFQF